MSLQWFGHRLPISVFTRLTISGKHHAIWMTRKKCEDEVEKKSVAAAMEFMSSAHLCVYRLYSGGIITFMEEIRNGRDVSLKMYPDKLQGFWKAYILEGCGG